MVSGTTPVSQSECRDSRSTSTKGNIIQSIPQSLKVILSTQTKIHMDEQTDYEVFFFGLCDATYIKNSNHLAADSMNFTLHNIIYSFSIHRIQYTGRERFMGYQGLKFSEFSLIPEFFPQAGRRQILYPIRPSMGVLLPNSSNPHTSCVFFSFFYLFRKLIN